MSEDADKYLTAEARARVDIDRMLTATGWLIQDRDVIDLYAARGVAVREFLSVKSETGAKSAPPRLPTTPRAPDTIARARPRLVEIATIDTLGLDNSIARNKVLMSGAGTALKLIEAEVVASYGGEVEEDEA